VRLDVVNSCRCLLVRLVLIVEVVIVDVFVKVSSDSMFWFLWLKVCGLGLVRIMILMDFRLCVNGVSIVECMLNCW